MQQLLQREIAAEILNSSVALAGGVLEALAVEDLYAATRVFNQACSF